MSSVLWHVCAVQVLCDQLGLGCSLVRGSYGRHWNEVTLRRDGAGSPKLYVVDLMFSPGKLLLAKSPEALAYQHL